MNKEVMFSSISIHALRAEGDRESNPYILRGRQFLSTPSVRRATRSINIMSNSFLYFYPRPPCGGRPLSVFGTSDFDIISIHALRAEGDGRTFGV